MQVYCAEREPCGLITMPSVLKVNLFIRHDGAEASRLVICLRHHNIVHDHNQLYW